MPARFKLASASKNMSAPKAALGVLLLHGWTNNAQSFRHLIPVLEAAQIPYSAPTYTGHGAKRSEALRGVQWTQWLADGNQALDQLLEQVHKVVVVSHSMGGWIGLHLSIDRSNQVDSVVLAGSSCRIASVFGLDRALYWLSPLIPRVVRDIKFTPSYTDKSLTCDHPGYRSVPSDSLRQLFAFIEATRSRLPKVSVPLLILHSKKDSLNSAKGAQQLYDLVATPESSKQLRWFDKTDHEMYLDCEYPLVNQVVMAYVQQRLSLASPP